MPAVEGEGDGPAVARVWAVYEALTEWAGGDEGKEEAA